LALEGYFAEGNKIAILGSSVYAPEFATDIDFMLFTKGGRNTLQCTPQFSREISEFLQSKTGSEDLRPHLIGPRDSVEDKPYNLEKLPKEDLYLDGCLLTGRFFPDDSFIKTHYESALGKDYLPFAWKRFAEHVMQFPIRDLRENKEKEDFHLLVHATKQLADNGFGELTGLIGRAEERYKILERQRSKGMDSFEYNSMLRLAMSDLYFGVCAFLPDPAKKHNSN